MTCDHSNAPAPVTTDLVTANWDEISKEARIERWENVRRVLRALPEHEREKHFDMATWGHKTECGTIACAAGHCGLDQWFRDRGFELNFRKSRMIPDVWIESLDSNTVESFFGEDGTDVVFLRTDSRSVDDVISEVEEFLVDLKDGQYD